MKIHRFIISGTNFNQSIISLTDPELLGQINNVLKLKIGEQIILGDGQNKEGVCQIKEINRRQIILQVLQQQKNNNEVKREIILYCALLKRENFEWVAQKATELGVTKIVPLLTARTVKTNIKADRLNKIVKEAAEQSGRGVIPILEPILPYSRAIETLSEINTSIVFDPSGKPFLGFKTKLSTGQQINLFIGPEGGFTAEELILAQNQGLNILNLGHLTLRGETAALAAVFWAANLV